MKNPAKSAALDNTMPPPSASLPSQRQLAREEWIALKRDLLLFCRVKWPRAFQPLSPLVLKTGVREDILVTAGDRFTDAQLGRFLAWWCRQPAYLEAVTRGGQRYNLDGSPVGAITADQRADADRRLAAIRPRTCPAEPSAPMQQAAE